MLVHLDLPGMGLATYSPFLLLSSHPVDIYTMINHIKQLNSGSSHFAIVKVGVIHNENPLSIFDTQGYPQELT